MRVRIAVAFVVACLAVVPAQAQVINPSAVEFDVSADHGVTVLGQPAVTKYELRLYAVGAPLPTSTFDLGKPTPATGTKVTVTNVAFFTPLPIGEYTARVAAIGPGGEGLSEATVPFGRLVAPSPPAAVTLK